MSNPVSYADTLIEKTETYPPALIFALSVVILVPWFMGMYELFDTIVRIFRTL